MKTRAALCLLLGVVVAWVFYRQRGFFPEHAALVGLAVAALGYSVLRVLDNLRRAARSRSPGNQGEGQD